MPENERWSRRCLWFDQSKNELHGALHTRWMWRTISAIIDQSGVPKHPTLLNYLSHTYAATVCSFVRRQASDNRSDAGLARGLRLLLSHPELATRDLFEARGAAAHDESDWNDRDGFRRFAPHGGDRIEQGVLEQALGRLKAASAPVKKYVDTSIAHSSQTILLTPAQITFAEIDHALDEVEEVVKQFYGLRYPGVELAFGTPVADLTFLRMFHEPWFPLGSTLPPNVVMYQYFGDSSVSIDR